MQAWKRIGPTKTYKAGWRTIVEKTFALPDGKQIDITTVDPEGSQAAAVIALTPGARAIVARQFRAAQEQIMDELPGGLVDEGEDPAAAAARELLEETGYAAGRLEYLGECSYDAYTNRRRHYFLAYDCVRRSKQMLGDAEFVEVRLVPITELFEIAKTNRMTDPGGVLLAYEKLKILQKEDA